MTMEDPTPILMCSLGTFLYQIILVYLKCIQVVITYKWNTVVCSSNSNNINICHPKATKILIPAVAWIHVHLQQTSTYVPSGKRPKNGKSLDISYDKRFYHKLFIIYPEKSFENTLIIKYSICFYCQGYNGMTSTYQ